MTEDRLLAVFCAPLYLIPIASAALHLTAAHEASWNGGHLLLGRSWPVRTASAIGMATVLLTLGVKYYITPVV